MSRSLIVGSQAPKFKYNLADGSSDSLANYLGGKVLICFYDKQKVKVFGISKDNELSHDKFIKKYNLKISLIPDPDLKIITKYGVLNEKGSARRTSFLIDESGKIINIWSKVNTKAHAEEVLKFLDEDK